LNTPIDISMNMSVDSPMEQRDGRWTLPEQAFYENEDLQTMILPEGLEVIAAAAFAGCVNLTQIQLPSTLREIGEGAFLGCVSLRHIQLPEGLAIIQDMAFWGSGLETVTVPRTVTHIGDNAFWDCPALCHADVLNPSTYMGTNAFGSCPTLISGHIAPGFPAEDSSSANLLYTLLWCSCPDRHTDATAAKAQQFIRQREDLIMERILKYNNIPAMTGLATRHLLSPERIDSYLQQSLEMGLTEITALLLAAKGASHAADDDIFAL